MTTPFIVLLVFAPVVAFAVMSYAESKKARTPINFLQFGTDYRSPSFFATLLASNSSLSGALFLIAFYGLLYGVSTFVWIFIFWFSTQLMSFYTVSWVESVSPGFIERRGTLHEFLGLVFGNDQDVRRIAAGISMFCYVGLLASEFVIGYGIISALISANTHIYGNLALEPAVTTLAVFGVVGGYCTLSGFRGVVRTDELQLLLILVMMLTVAIYIQSTVLLVALSVLTALAVISWIIYSVKAKRTQAFPAPQPIKDHPHELTFRDVVKDLPRRWIALTTFLVIVAIWWFTTSELGASFSFADVVNPTPDPPLKFFLFFVVANILFWLVWWPAAMDQWHRCAATKDFHVPQHWLLGTIGIVPVAYLGLLSLTFLLLGSEVASANPNAADPLAAFLDILRGNNDGAPAPSRWLFVSMCTGLVAAMVSTADSYLVVATQTWICDWREARNNGRTLSEIETDASDPAILLRMRVAVVLIFVTAAVLAIPLLMFFSDPFAAIYFFFSGMLVLAGVIFVAFATKRSGRREQLAPKVRGAMYGGMIYVLVTNVPIIIMLELTLRGLVNGSAWYLQAGNWYYAVYSNPVIAMFVTMFLCFFGVSVRKRSNVENAV